MQAPAVRARSAQRARKLLVRALGLTLTAYVLWCAALHVKQTDLIFPRAYATSALPSVPPGFEVWTLALPDGGRVEAWYIAGVGRTPESPGPAVMLFHGNAELIDNWVDVAMEYQARGMSVLLPEYRGYGRSAGTPSQASITQDMLAWHTQLALRSEVRSGAIVYHGRSLGGGVAAELARQREPAALILDCTFTSVASFARGYLVPSFIVRSPFRTDRVLPGLACPILISHGRDDTIVPFAHAEMLAGLTSNAELLALPGGHLDFPGDVAAYDAARWRLLRRAGLLE